MGLIGAMGDGMLINCWSLFWAGGESGLCPAFFGSGLAFFTGFGLTFATGSGFSGEAGLGFS